MTLRPDRRRVVAQFGMSLALLALSVLAVTSSWVGGVGVLLFGFATVNAAVRLMHPRAYATELTDTGFRVHDWRGALVHDVPWATVVRVTAWQASGRIGGNVNLAWRCEPRRPGRGRVQTWAKGGRTRSGEEIDGALPDPYLGPRRMAELFAGRIDGARAGAAAPVPDLSTF